MDAARAEALADVIVVIMLAGDRAHAWVAANAAWLREKIVGEIRLGQWVMVAGPHAGLLGFMSWYRVSDEVLEILMDSDWDWLLERGDVNDLCHGENCFVGTVVIAPWAPANTARQLYRATRWANSDCRRFGGTRFYRDRTMAYHEYRNIAYSEDVRNESKCNL